MKKIIFTLLAVIALVSCGKQGDSLQYIPFQEKEGGKWGLIGTDGKVLFANKFDYQPTVAMHDRFFVQNDSNRWELYSAEKEPKRIGSSEYIQAGVFKEDVAPVVEKGKKIQLIDKDGNVKVTLENIDDVPVDECTNFSEGVAIIRVGGYYGCINTKGKLLIKPEYSLLYPANDGKIVAFNREDEDTDGKGNRTWKKITILSTSGKIVSTFDFSKYVECGEQFHDGALMVEVKDSATDKHYQGLVDENGNYIIKPSTRTTKIGSFFGKDFTFINDDNKVGVMNQKGDILIGAKYMSASCTSKKGIFHALESPEAKGMVILNEKGDMINKEYYANALDFHGSMAAVAYSVNDWGFINEKGENVKTDSKISFVDDSNVGDVSVQSDYFDEESLDNTFYIHDDSALGISLETMPQDVVGHLNKFLDILMPRREEKYIGKNEIESELFSVGNACVKVKVNYKQPVVKPSMAKSPYGGTFMAGYIWDTDVKPFSITLTIS